MPEDRASEEKAVALVFFQGQGDVRHYVVLTDGFARTATEGRAKNSLSPVTAISRHTVDLSWLGDISPEVAVSPEGLLKLYRDIQDSFRAGDFRLVDALLRAVEIERLPPKTLAALLRYSFGARDELPSWNSFLTRVRSELGRRQVDDKALLYGL